MSSAKQFNYNYNYSYEPQSTFKSNNFTFGNFQKPKQNSDSDSQSNSNTNLVVQQQPIKQNIAVGAPKTLKQKQQQNNKQNNNMISFHRKMLEHRQSFPAHEIETYSNNVRKYNRFNDLTFFGLIGYMIYQSFSKKKIWFQLTNYNSAGYVIGGFGFFFIIGIFTNNRIQRQNYQLYKRNKVIIDNFLSDQQKKQIRLAELIKQYQ